MERETLHTIVTPNGEYRREHIGISTEEWYNLLLEPKATLYIDALTTILREPDPKGKCSMQYYNNKITKFSQWVQMRLNRFNIIDTDGDAAYWAITMQSGIETKQGTEWQLRNELTEALRMILMRDLIDTFKSGKPFNGYEEGYKWGLLDKSEGMPAVEIAKCIIGQGIIDDERTTPPLSHLTSKCASEFESCCNNLFDESRSIDERIHDFKDEMRQICPDKWKICANDERTASALLACKYPEKYTFYKDEVYQIICNYFGIERKKTGHKFSHFTEIINDFVSKYGDEVQTIISPQITTYHNKPLNLAIQTIFWCMRDYLNNKMNKDMKFNWIPFYTELSEKLLQYKNKREELVEFIYSEDGLGKYTNYLHTSDKSQKISDIDPFSFFGIFNTGNKRNAKIENRKDILSRIKSKFDIKADVPSDFEGIPVLNYIRSFYYDWNNITYSCDILWDAYENLLNNKPLDKFFNYKKFTTCKSETTMPLFWIKPDKFIALDSRDTKYLFNRYKINTTSIVDYQSYSSFTQDLIEKMKKNEIKENSFAELSANAFNYQNDTNEGNSWYESIVETWRKRKNIVLYGAPGTGKTYDVPELAVRLCDPAFDADNESRETLMKRYHQLKRENRIAFTTFHQSMDYEDWIEGLRPIVDDNNQVRYEIEKGIFKKLCEDAEKPIVKDKGLGIADDAVIWKVSLMGTGDNPVRTDCMKNDYIRIGWDKYGPIISDETDWSKHNGEGKQILDAFINKMKIGDIVLSCYTNRTIDAIGVVTGDYEYQDKLPNYKRVRHVNWIIKGIDENIVGMNEGKTMTLSTVYRLNSITLENVKSLLEKHKKTTTMETNSLPFVMVIDEMNRGNVSKIFGELITLLEADKRKGCENEESVILPYSKKTFQIPENVHIIATMNTADRSLGTLDYAIRRRFAFVADKPFSLEGKVAGFDEELFKKVSSLFISNYEEYKESSWDKSFVLKHAETLSAEYKPEDVWIGHSYFIMNDDNTSERLRYEIIPLLEEYLRDGVLTTEANKTIEELYQRATIQ